jgi:hypothetical protein
LNSNGDCDFNKRFNSGQNSNAKPKIDREKSIKFAQNNTNNNNSGVDQPFSFSNLNRESAKSVNLNDETQTNSKSKLKKQAGKLAKSVFTKKPNDTGENIPFTSAQTTTKKETKTINNKKYEEIKDASFESQNSNTVRESKLTNELDESPDVDASHRWSGVNDSIKAYDSENEEIPLVVKSKDSKHHKKQSNSITAPITTSTNASAAKLKSTSAAHEQSSSKILSKENKGFQT